MSAIDDDNDPVEALRIDTEVTRAELAETVSELSDRLSPKKQAAAVAQGVTESTKQVVGQAHDVTKDTATKAQDVAKVGITRGRQLTDGMEPQLIGAVAVVIGLLIVWRLWKHRR